MVIDFYQLRERESTNHENQGMELLDFTVLIDRARARRQVATL